MGKTMPDNYIHQGEWATDKGIVHCVEHVGWGIIGGWLNDGDSEFFQRMLACVNACEGIPSEGTRADVAMVVFDT